MARFNAPTSMGSESSFPLRRRKGKSTRGRGTNGDVLTLLVLCLVVGIVLLWVVGAYKFLNQLRVPTSVSSSHKVRDPSRDLPEEVYAHWQPPTPSSMECSWRECFKKDHTCSTCRDLLEDLGTPPPVPDQWVPDVTFLQRMRLQGHDANGNPWPPPLDAELCEPIGVFGGKNDDNKLLLDTVPIQASPFRKDPITTSFDHQPRLPKIMCMIYTMESRHHLTIRAIRETWASGCDGFLAFSTVSDPRIPAIALPHEGPEEYENMWQKIRSIFKFVGTHYLDDFDFFFQGGEDLFVLPQNLKQYLATLGTGAAEEDYFVGRRFLGYGRGDNYFNSGGAGYALSRATLRKYITEGYDHPKCNPHKKTSMEDVMIAQCLRDVFNIGLTDTRDDMLRERFHPFSPGSHYSWKPPTEGNRDWYADYNKEWPPLLKEQCCAPDSVSFHYIKKAAMVRHLHALLYECGH
eukprot:Nitzschia sp. Nitz4//scaffold355_size15944//12272//13768//NITZ4_008868-RA/size15944-processed-gene-0.19-mRNA-1//-1//CDS//3329548951//1925//frame0